MAALFKVTDRVKGILILLAWVFAHLNRIAQALVKIADDSEVTTAEAIAFVTSEGPVWVGEWKDRGKDKPPASTDASTAPHPSSESFAEALAEEAAEMAGDFLKGGRKTK
jgi:hypothetical protein